VATRRSHAHRIASRTRNAARQNLGRVCRGTGQTRLPVLGTPCVTSRTGDVPCVSLSLQWYAAGVEPKPCYQEIHTVPLSDRCGVGARVGVLEEDGARQQAASEPVRFLHLFRVAGKEGVAGDLLEVTQVVVERHVSELVRDIPHLACAGSARGL
jgi:hypothetical protein